MTAAGTLYTGEMYFSHLTNQAQALADISHLVPCCHSNENRALIANPPNSAQLEGTPYHSLSYIRVRAVVWERGEGQTNRQTHAHCRWP